MITQFKPTLVTISTANTALVNQARNISDARQAVKLFGGTYYITDANIKHSTDYGLDAKIELMEILHLDERRNAVMLQALSQFTDKEIFDEAERRLRKDMSTPAVSGLTHFALDDI